MAVENVITLVKDEFMKMKISEKNKKQNKNKIITIKTVLFNVIP